MGPVHLKAPLPVPLIFLAPPPPICFLRWLIWGEKRDMYVHEVVLIYFPIGSFVWQSLDGMGLIGPDTSFVPYLIQSVPVS